MGFCERGVAVGMRHQVRQAAGRLTCHACTVWLVAAVAFDEGTADCQAYFGRPCCCGCHMEHRVPTLY